MDTGVISGLIGGIISVVLISHLSSKIRNSTEEGKLRYGWGLLVLGLCCLAFVGLAIWAFFYDLDAWEKPRELFSIIGLFIGFGAGAIYTFGEYLKVHGSYDERGIVFHTPWTGTKNEKWENLISVKFNSNLNWYVLKFQSGKKIRLSNLLGGHGGVLRVLEGKGFDF